MKIKYILGFCFPAIFALLLAEMNRTFMDVTSYKWIAVLILIIFGFSLIIYKFGFPKKTTQPTTNNQDGN